MYILRKNDITSCANSSNFISLEEAKNREGQITEGWTPWKSVYLHELKTGFYIIAPDEKSIEYNHISELPFKGIQYRVRDGHIHTNSVELPLRDEHHTNIYPITKEGEDYLFLQLAKRNTLYYLLPKNTDGYYGASILDINLTPKYLHQGLSYQINKSTDAYISENVIILPYMSKKHRPAVYSITPGVVNRAHQRLSPYIVKPNELLNTIKELYALGIYIREIHYDPNADAYLLNSLNKNVSHVIEEGPFADLLGKANYLDILLNDPVSSINLDNIDTFGYCSGRHISISGYVCGYMGGTMDIEDNFSVFTDQEFTYIPYAHTDFKKHYVVPKPNSQKYKVFELRSIYYIPPEIRIANTDKRCTTVAMENVHLVRKKSDVGMELKERYPALRTFLNSYYSDLLDEFSLEQIYQELEIRNSYETKQHKYIMLQDNLINTLVATIIRPKGGKKSIWQLLCDFKSTLGENFDTYENKKHFYEAFSTLPYIVQDINQCLYIPKTKLDDRDFVTKLVYTMISFVPELQPFITHILDNSNKWRTLLLERYL